MKKKPKRPSSSGGGGWEVVYSGFVLILLCFFIMLSSFASIEEGRIGRFVKSFVNSVSILSGGLKFEPGARVMRQSSDIVDKEDDLAQIYADIQSIRKELQLKDQIGVDLSEDGLLVRISDTALFDVGVADLSKDAIPLMKEIARTISQIPYAVRIEGHTDNIPIHTRRFPSNWELSTARAIGVLRYLLEEEHIPSERLFAVGFGEYRPAFPNDTAEHRAGNRRVEIVIDRQT
ncbi:MAG: flagellar motor protein MotB [Thermodesulfobacteriota bacterium]|nr:flagellar motor protein MotB [Thermodesulfobacteriota bacterium]